MREKKQVQEAGYIHSVNVLRKSLYYGLFFFLEHLLIHSKLNCHALFLMSASYCIEIQAS